MPSLRIPNAPYVVTPISDVEIVSGEEFNLNVSENFGDMNEDIDSYSAEGLPEGLTIDSSSGLIGGTPTESGNFRVTVTVEDTAGGVVEDEFNIDVEPTLDANDYAALKAFYNSTSNWRNASWDVSSETPPPASVVGKWHGVTVRGSRVTEIDLDNTEWSRVWRKLVKMSDNALSGTIPSELGSLSELQTLELNDNDLSGTIPSELGELSNLSRLQLNDNDLSGTIPSKLGDLSNLIDLHLNDNSLSGTIPSKLGELSNLIGLHLQDNSLSGTIPSELGDLKLWMLYLYNNSLRGTIPNSINVPFSSFHNPPYLETQIDDQEANVGEEFSFNVSDNFGDINNNINSYNASGLPEGLTINSSSGLIGGTPTESGNFRVTVKAGDARGDAQDEFYISVVEPTLDANDYAALKAFYNSTSNWRNASWDVSSETPPPASVVGKWHGVTVRGSRVTEIDLDNTEWSRVWRKLVKMSDNALSGTIPSELGSLSELQTLELNDNDLSGTIPSELGELSNLSRLQLNDNDLSGTIPSKLGDLSNLIDLHLNDNSLSGTIPSKLGELSNLIGLHLQDNSLSGTIPSELGDLKLWMLYLYNNSLRGTIPNSINVPFSSFHNPPYLETQIDDQEANVGEEFSFNVSDNFGDINNNINSYNASGLPEGLTINSSSGLIGGTPTTDGSFDVTVTVSDKTGRSVKDKFEIEVLPPYPITGTSEDDMLQGTEIKDIPIGDSGEDILKGGKGHDILNGGDGDDMPIGGDGDDMLIGGGGKDILKGGKGADTFVLTPGQGWESIRDFEDGTDSIQLEGGLSFADLQMTPLPGNLGTVIEVTASKQALAVLWGINSGSDELIGAPDLI
ncbi:MAG: putative Ig domain-containing protein [Hormoscilla sp. GUM202]|nr:putative Ig domain-containing protein [Hormoscilla sp. GUM202]